MFDKMINLGIGAFYVTKEKAEAFMDEMVERGEISKEDARQTMDEMVQKGQEQREEVVQMIREEIDNWKNKIGVVTKADLEKLEERIREMESKLP